MGGYGEAAIKAVRLVSSKEVTDPVEAWKIAIIKIFDKKSSRCKGCPKNAFLGLCEEGLVKGIPVDSYTRSIENKKYAVNAVRILQKNPKLLYDPIKLWFKSIGDKSIAHNDQMDVVISLWKNNLLMFCVLRDKLLCIIIHFPNWMGK